MWFKLFGLNYMRCKLCHESQAPKAPTGARDQAPTGHRPGIPKCKHCLGNDEEEGGGRQWKEEGEEGEAGQMPPELIVQTRREKLVSNRPDQIESVWGMYKF